MKKFFDYSKHCSVTDMLFVLGLPSFNTVIHNFRCSCMFMWNHHYNEFIVMSLWHMCLFEFSVFIFLVIHAEHVVHSAWILF